MNVEASEILNKYPTNSEYPTYYHFKDVLEAMHEFAALTVPKWVSVDTPPTDDFWKQVLIDGKHHVLPHCVMNGKWWCYGESHPTNQNVTHYREFTDF